MPKEAKYPMVPKSTASLVPGQFWPVPVCPGRWACGRVLQLGSPVSPRKAFLAGLMDWLGSEPPSFESLAGSQVRQQGVAHLKAIIEVAGAITGCRPLALDRIEPLLCRDQAAPKGSIVLRGFVPVRPATTEADFALPVLGTWGYDFIRRLAEHHYGNVA